MNPFQQTYLELCGSLVKREMSMETEPANLTYKKEKVAQPFLIILPNSPFISTKNTPLLSVSLSFRVSIQIIFQMLLPYRSMRSVPRVSLSWNSQQSRFQLTDLLCFSTDCILLWAFSTVLPCLRQCLSSFASPRLDWQVEQGRWGGSPENR